MSPVEFTIPEIYPPSTFILSKTFFLPPVNEEAKKIRGNKKKYAEIFLLIIIMRIYCKYSVKLAENVPGMKVKKRNVFGDAPFNETI